MSQSFETIAAPETASGGALNENHEPDRQRREDASEDLREQIAVAAYYLAESRGFSAGQELEDWRIAEAAILGPS